MALDAADTVKGNGLTQEQLLGHLGWQLIIAAQEGALVVAEAGGTKKETYTAVGTALHKVAELYDHPEALDWWEESFTKDRLGKQGCSAAFCLEQAILQIATDAAHDAEANGLNDEILAAAQAAQVASAERGYETREQESTRLLCGRDALAGGTVLALHRKGTFCALTNWLLVEHLAMNGFAAAEGFLQERRMDSFHVVAGEAFGEHPEVHYLWRAPLEGATPSDDGADFEWRSAQRRLEPGVFVVSNENLAVGDAWPKSEWLRRRLAAPIKPGSAERPHVPLNQRGPLGGLMLEGGRFLQGQREHCRVQNGARPPTKLSWSFQLASRAVCW
ncbi:unnamed protein product [Effrenium voratum]|nr:unnamed protein product [Effrenium voratum]